MRERNEQHASANTNRVAWVTGGSGAIGGAVAEQFAARGVRVMLGYGSNRDLAVAQAEHLKSTYGTEVQHIHSDIRDRLSIHEATNEILKRTQRIDILVHAAGITRDKLMLHMREADFTECLDVNVTSGFHLLQAVLPTMQQQHYGRIVMITSYAGVHGRAGQAAYAASKAALIGLTKSTALEMIEHGITINAVAPSVIQSAMTDSLTDAERMRLLEAIPLGRMQSPDETARLIDWLTSEQSGTISGQLFTVDTRPSGW